MWPCQYDEYYFIMEQADSFLKFDDLEDEEAFSRCLKYGRYH